MIECLVVLGSVVVVFWLVVTSIAIVVGYTEGAGGTGRNPLFWYMDKIADWARELGQRHE